jgi:hypothetical protein
VIRTFVLANVSDRIVDPVPAPLVAPRVDAIGEVPVPLAHLDIAEFSAAVDASRSNAVLSLTTRRSFPPDTAGRVVDFHFLLDLDGNAETGGAGTAAAVPTDFTGVEFVVTIRARGLRVESVAARRWEPGARAFEPVDPKRISATLETLEAIPDFPFLRSAGPDGDGELPRFPVGELASVIVPAGLLSLPTASAFRVEYVTVDAASGVVDLARSPGMRFDLPVFPECRTEPGIVDRGDTATVFASGMLPDRDVHLLLGADEVGSGHTDAEGKVKLALPIPADARFGPRLVTVGALAVSADCSVTVRDPDSPPGDDAGEPSLFERCCRRLSVQLWVLIVLVLIVLIVLIVVVVRRRRSQ